MDTHRHDTETGTGRIARLHSRIDEHVRATNNRMVQSDEGQQAYAPLLLKVFSANRGRPEVIRKAEFLECFAREFPIEIHDDELIVGSQRFNGPNVKRFLTEEQWRQAAVHGNIGHIIVDYGRVLREGVAGLRARVGNMDGSDEVLARNRDAFARALNAFAVFIRRHADAARQKAEALNDASRRAELLRIAENCDRIAEQPPQTFWEALQLTWFVQVFLHAEAKGVAISFGRLDQYLWPFLERDLQQGILTEADAADLLACFWLKCCEGDESQNLTVGGVDEHGRGAENPLSRLCLRVARDLRVWQPSVSVRIGPETSDEFWREALELCAAGFGQPSFFNDAVVVRSLEAAGIPTARARDWGIVGCYEATPQGDTYGLTVAGTMTLPTVFLSYLECCGKPGSFDEFYSGFTTFLVADYAERLKEYQGRWDGLARNAASPFESVCLTGCIESGLAAEEGGGRFNLFGVNILGLGTLIDSLWAVKDLVYEKGRCTLRDLRVQVERNFPDESLLMQCRNLAGKYGSDTAFTNHLAEDLSRTIAELVLRSRLAGDIRPYPAFFRFLADVNMSLPATPDGRRSGDRISHGTGPGVLCKEATATSIINSTAHVAHDLCGCGNPLLLSFSRSDITGREGLRRLRQVIETYFDQGGFHVHVNIVNAEQLREAQEKPTEHSQLTVKISGFSARFVALDRNLQEAIVERTERGM